LQRYRTGTEGPISHLKRGYGLRRSKLKGDDRQKTTTDRLGDPGLQPRHAVTDLRPRFSEIVPSSTGSRSMCPDGDPVSAAVATTGPARC
jgi:hypothetical protein